MNNVVLMGRLTRDPDIRYSQGDPAMCIARYTLAVDRRFKRDGEPTADFIPCVSFGKNAEFTEKYLTKGSKIALNGHIQTGSYEKDGQRIYTTEVIVDGQEFAESKASAESRTAAAASVQEGSATPDGFTEIPEAMQEELPWM